MPDQIDAGSSSADDRLVSDDMRSKGQEPPAAAGRAAFLSETFAELLGMQTAEIVHAMDRWFGHLSAQLEGNKAKPETTAKTSAPESAGAPLSAPAGIGPRIPAILALPPQPRSSLPEPVLQTTSVVTFDIGQSWDGWTFHQSVTMHPHGRLEVRQHQSTPGVITTAAISLPQGGLYRVTIKAEFTPGGPHPQLRVASDKGEHMGPDFDLKLGLSEVFVFIPRRVTMLKLMIVVRTPRSGFAFQVQSLELENVNEDSYFARSAYLAPAPTIASLASIPERQPMLVDTVKSLLLQCDRVRVFLNEYPDVPEFLNHPRVDLRRSQDWDDKGDAGKFGWIDEKDEPGFRVIVDDDLIFPPDFCERMIETLASYNNRAIVATHGVLLKQPVAHYYEPTSRSVQHFQNRLGSDRTVHVLGTNAMMYYSPCVTLRWNDFMFRNMADIFLANYAQRENIPMISVKRPQYWVRQNTQEGGFKTIYEQSLKKTQSKFDSSSVQDSLVKYYSPLTLQPTMRPKVVVMLFATSSKAFSDAFTAWSRHCWDGYDWCLIVAAATDDPDLRHEVAAVSTTHELHIVDSEATASDRVLAALSLTLLLKPALVAVALDVLQPMKGSWPRTMVGQMQGGLAFASLLLGEEGAATAKAAVPPSPSPSGRVIGGLFTAPFQTAEAALPLPSAQQAFDHCLALLSRDVGRQLPETRIAGEIEQCFVVGELAPAVAVLSEPSKGQAPAPVTGTAEWETVPPLTINALFERVVIINLDRRADRWTLMEEELQRAQVSAERWLAVDGLAPEIAAEYDDYAKQPLTTVSSVVRPILTSKDYYFNYVSQRSRVAHLEKKSGRKAIESAGAWAYLRSWESILEKALLDRVETLLVFDDDVMFHQQTQPIFAAATVSLPPDWMILQLGTLQYHWTDDWMTRDSRFLYHTNGTAIGSHAVGLRFAVLPFLLDHVKRMELPFDTGALAAATRAFRDQSFVVTPNVAIQRLAGDSDINTSTFQQSKEVSEAARTYRWNLADFASASHKKQDSGRRKRP